MSFFKKLTDGFEELSANLSDKKDGKDKDKKKDEVPQAPPALQPQYGSPPILPPGWISQWDPTSQRPFYVEQATGRTQWEPPVVALSQFSPPPPGGYAPSPVAAAGVAGEEKKEKKDKDGGEKKVKKDKDGEEKKEKKGGAGKLLAKAGGGLFKSHKCKSQSPDSIPQYNSKTIYSEIRLRFRTQSRRRGA
jgi:WW domain